MVCGRVGILGLLVYGAQGVYHGGGGFFFFLGQLQLHGELIVRDSGRGLSGLC